MSWLNNVPTDFLLCYFPFVAVIDDNALIAAINNGHIRGAALDCFVEEPMPKDHPYWEMADVQITPHIAGVTEESNVRVSAVTAENVREALEQRP